jgi:hypothetical protein
MTRLLTRQLGVLALAGALAVACSAAAGVELTPDDVAQRVADVIHSHSEVTRDKQTLSAAVDVEFADERPRFNGDDGAPFSPIASTGVMRNAEVRPLANDAGIGVALLFADAQAREGGDMYCVLVKVPQRGKPRWTTAEADFTQANHCPGAPGAAAWRTITRD